MSFETSFRKMIRGQKFLAHFQISRGDIHKWKVKKQIKPLQSATGNGNTLVSLFIVPADRIAQVTKRLDDLCRDVSKIKNQESVLGVLSAVISAMQGLQHYNQVPCNGLVFYSGTLVGQDKVFTKEFLPVKPITSSFCICDKKFYTEALYDFMFDDAKYGFVIMNKKGVLIGSLWYNVKEILYKFSVNLPMKYCSSGGRSALEFAHFQMEERQNYLGKIRGLITEFFINPATDKANIRGLIVAVSPCLSPDLALVVDSRLRPVLKSIEISYGGETGFNEAIILSARELDDSKYLREIDFIKYYFNEIGQQLGNCVHGVDATMHALEMNYVFLLLVWEDLMINRYVLVNSATGTSITRYLSTDQEADQSNFSDPDTNAQLEVAEKTSLTEWLADEYDNGRLYCNLEFVTNKSPEGSQFCSGFGGIGGILTCQLDISDDEEV